MVGGVGDGGHDPVLWDALLVRSQDGGDFAADEAYEGAWQHLVGLSSCVLKVVVGVSQNVEQSLNQFFILWGRKGAS